MCWPRWRPSVRACSRSRIPPSVRPSSRRSPTTCRVRWIRSRSRPCSDASLPTSSSRAALEWREPRCPGTLKRGAHRAERLRRRAAPLGGMSQRRNGRFVGIGRRGPLRHSIAPERPQPRCTPNPSRPRRGLRPKVHAVLTPVGFHCRPRLA